MIMPSKHISFAESLLGLGSYILEQLNNPKRIEELWSIYEKVNNTPKYPAYHSFDNFILALDFLYLIGSIEINERHEIFYVPH